MSDAPGSPGPINSTASSASVHANAQSSAPPVRTPSRTSIIATELGGDLPCVRCGYNLKGLSIRSVCPECGTPMRATLLAVVDPLAGELRPIPRPKLTAAGVLVWSTAALVAAMGVWFMRLLVALPQDAATARTLNTLGLLVIALTALSGLGSISLLRPHEGIKPQSRKLAALGVLAYIPLVIVLWRLNFDLGGYGAGLLHAGDSGAMALGAGKLRVLADGLLMLIIVGLRPNARLLASRSVLMRTGRVDRQTMLALVGVLGVMMLGDAAALASVLFDGPVGDGMRMIGHMVVVVGAVLFTVGLAGVAVDCWRMRPVIAGAPVSLEKLFGQGGPVEG